MSISNIFKRLSSDYSNASYTDSSSSVSKFTKEFKIRDHWNSDNSTSRECNPGDHILFPDIHTQVLPMSPAESYQMSEENIQAQALYRSVFTKMRDINEFEYKPGFNNDIRECIIELINNHPQEFPTIYDDLLNVRLSALDEDKILELINSASSQIEDVDNDDLKTEVLRIIRKRLYSNEVAVVDVTLEAIDRFPEYLNKSYKILKHLSYNSEYSMIRDTAKDIINGIGVAIDVSSENS